MIKALVVLSVLIISLSKGGAAEFMWGITGVGGAPSTLYAINPANGQILGVIGDTGAVCLSGLEIQPGSGALLAGQGQQSPLPTSAKSLFQINKATGAASSLGALASKYAMSDVAMSQNGTLFAFGVGSTVKKLLSFVGGTVNEIGSTNNITNVGITFGLNGTLYLVRGGNGLFTVNPGTGVMSAVTPIVGALLDNFLATSASGAIYGGARTGGGTDLYVLNTTTGAATFAATVPGVTLSGITFDNAAAPVFAVGGKKKIKTTKATVTLKGTATSLLPLTVSAKKVKPAVVAGGKWSLKVKLKSGRNVVNLVCADGLGQSAVAKVTITRN